MICNGCSHGEKRSSRDRYRDGHRQKAQTVTTEHGSYQYDRLLISLGGESNDFGTPGVKEHGFELWSFEQAMALRAHLSAIIRRGRRSSTLLSAKPC